MGMRPGVNIIVNGNLPNMLEDSMPILQNRRKPKTATANGTYLARGSKFRIRKGSPIPEGVEVIYDDEDQEAVTASDVFAARIASEKAVEDDDAETTSEDEVETTSDDEAESRPARKQQDKKAE